MAILREQCKEPSISVRGRKFVDRILSVVRGAVLGGVYQLRDN